MTSMNLDLSNMIQATDLELFCMDIKVGYRKVENDVLYQICAHLQERSPPLLELLAK
jgi:hypothetical protein